jgi:hypothetical protein
VSGIPWERIEATAKWLHDVGTSAMWGMHAPEVWPALGDRFAAKDGIEESQVRAYVHLSNCLSLVVAEYEDSRVNATPSRDGHGRVAGGRPPEP